MGYHGDRTSKMVEAGRINMYVLVNIVPLGKSKSMIEDLTGVVKILPKS